MGGSWYYGRYTPSFLPSESLWSLAGDWKSGFGHLEIEGEYVFTHFGGIRNVAAGLARVARDQESEFENPTLESEVEFELANLATSKQGYWLEFRYRFWPDFLTKSFLGWEFENPQLVAVLRGEQVWLDGLVDGGGVQRRPAHLASTPRTVASTASRRASRIVRFRSSSSSSPTSTRMTNSGKSLSSVTNFIPGDVDHQSAFLVRRGIRFLRRRGCRRSKSCSCCSLLGPAFARADDDGGGGEEADPPEVVIGERLFLETRFAQFFQAHVGGNVNAVLALGDPVMRHPRHDGRADRGPVRRAVA